MENIFNNAYFGKPYRMRSGQKALFSHTFFSKEDNEDFALLMIPQEPKTEYNKDSLKELLVSLDGTWHRKKYESSNDIIGEYSEKDSMSEQEYEEKIRYLLDSCIYWEASGPEDADLFAEDFKKLLDLAPKHPKTIDYCAYLIRSKKEHFNEVMNIIQEKLKK